jgi:EPS-associated MarR family transcriptional regulator
MNAPDALHRKGTEQLRSESEVALALHVLRLLGEQPQLSQRQLSKALGLSLGKTHYVLRALLGKGILKIENFRRSDNKLAYAYLLTPKGLQEKLQMSKAFLLRQEQEFAQLQKTIADLRKEVQAQGEEFDPADR